MKVYLIGVGMGNPATLTGQALEAIGSLPGCALSISSTGISPNRMAASCSFGVR